MDRTPLRFIQKVSAFDALVMEKELTTKGRKQIKPENFAIPEKAPGSGSYPIHDLVHARNALARVSQHGTASEKARVRKAVYSKYPALKERKEENVSIFDDVISERELPEAFKKNMGRGFGKKKAEPEDDSKATDADDAAECGESVSLFDGIVQESGRSIFDDVVQESANWEDRVARTIVLSEELGKIRSSIKNR